MKAFYTITMMACLLCLNACNLASFPTHNSDDRHIYTSTPELPLKITVVEAQTGEPIIGWYVPAHKKLVLDFQRDRSGYSTNTGYLQSSHLSWALIDDDGWIFSLPNKQLLPNAPVKIKQEIQSLEEKTGGTIALPPVKTAPVTQVNTP